MRVNAVRKMLMKSTPELGLSSHKFDSQDVPNFTDWRANVCYISKAALGQRAWLRFQSNYFGLSLLA